MDPGFKPLYRTITNYGFALTFATASSFVFGFLMLGDISRVSRWGWVTLAAFLCLSVGVQVGTYIVHRQNHAWRRVPGYLHDVNHLYRDVLSSLFFRKNPTLNSEELLEVEQQILDKACSRIAALFQDLTGKVCTATVYLIKGEPNENKTAQACFIWATSEQHVDRQRYVETPFPITKATNTRFQRILELIEEKQRPLYFSRDITRETPEYHDSLPHAASYYRSVICVPVKCTISVSDREQQSCIIGFLSIDVNSAGRLNSDFHADYAAAFADQMFNFICIMRKYFELDGPEGGVADSADASAS